MINAGSPAALISVYAPISSMRLLTRVYGIPLRDIYQAVYITFDSSTLVLTVFKHKFVPTKRITYPWKLGSYYTYIAIVSNIHT